MSLQNKQFQSYDSFRSHKIITQNGNNFYQKQHHKSLVTFTPNHILKNTEYLTNLQNYLSIMKPYRQVEFDYLYEGIDPGSLCKIIVQNIYLLQICYLFKMKVYLSHNFYTEKGKYIPTTPNLNIFQLYCFENEFNTKKEGHLIKQTVLEHKFVKVFQYQDNRMDDFFFILDLRVKQVDNYLNEVEKSLKSSNLSSNLSSSSLVNQDRKYLSEFVKVYQTYLQPQKSLFSEPKSLIKFLEHTKLFRSHSLLVKIVNNTLLYSIKIFSKQLLSNLKDSLRQMSKYFGYESGETNHEEAVVKTIDNFFTKMCMLNVIEITKSLKGANEQKHSLEKDTLSLFDYDGIMQTKYPTIVASILVSEQRYLLVSTGLFQRILQNQEVHNLPFDKEMILPKNIEIQISYTYAINEISVKCITDIDVLVDNMDYLNYLIASFNQGMKSTLVVDTIQKFRRSMTKKIEKVVAFKMTYRGKSTEEPLTKILQLIDVGIIASKIFITELSRKSYIKLEQYEKRERICDMFRHYQDIFKSLTRKFYTDIKAGK